MTPPKAALTHNQTQHFVVICHDTEQAADLRAATLAEHRSHTENWASSIVLSGPLVDDDGETRTGQFYVVGGESKTAAQEFIDDDPFTIAGVFASIDITRMLPRYQHGTRSRSIT